MQNYSSLPNNKRGHRGHILIVKKNPFATCAASRALRQEQFQTTILGPSRPVGPPTFSLT